MKYLRNGGQTSGGFGVVEVLDGLNDVEVSKGVFGCLDTCHHPDEDQCFTTRRTWEVEHFVDIRKSFSTNKQSNLKGMLLGSHFRM